jgi:RNA-directed DNA polymerase
MVAWQDIPWRHVHGPVFRLQQRIYRATPRGQVRTAHKLQKLLIKSWYARLLAVRRELRLDGTATPLRRTRIPKRGSPEQRPLGIPTRGDRARHTLVRQALEPGWEAKLAPHTYGFRLQ